MWLQGLQDKLLFSIIKFATPKGENPNSLTVEPKIETTGIPTAVAVCIKPESLQITILQFFIFEAVSNNLLSLEKLNEPSILLFNSLQISLSDFPPKMAISKPSFLSKFPTFAK
jgi:hypothetical protein